MRFPITNFHRRGRPLEIGLKSQSAMEYLMTYGWAILIISVVLATLFQLGVFSGAMSPRARPGSCQVLRPYGPGSTAYISLGGVCTGQLPQFMASFDGQSSHISVGRWAGLNFKR